jgi:hypothetical protein
MPKCNRSHRSPSARTNRCLPWRRLDSKRCPFNRRASSRPETPFKTYALRISTPMIRWCNDVASRYRLNISTSGSSGIANVTQAIVPANAQCARDTTPQTGLSASRFLPSLGKAMSSNSIDDFLQLLRKSPSGAVFNPWWELDKENDISRGAPAIRRNQLRAYLQKRLRKAHLVVIGEALGYRGGHFSGIPMTSERLLLGRSTNVPMKSNDFFFDINPRRTSKPEKCPDGFSEPTATIVWGTLLRLGLKPDQFVLWNAFPWHSFDPRRGMLSNRMPNTPEQAAGLPVLKAFLELFQCEQVVALGKIAAAQLEELDVNAPCARHPASGGARLFPRQIAELVRRVRH